MSHQDEVPRMWTARPDSLTGLWSLVLPVDDDPPRRATFARQWWRRLTAWFATPEPWDGWSDVHRVNDECPTCGSGITIYDRTHAGAMARRARWLDGHRYSLPCREALLGRRMGGPSPSHVVLDVDGSPIGGRRATIVDGTGSGTAAQ